MQPDERSNPYESPGPAAQEPAESRLTTFSILDLLGLTTVVALNCGAWAWEPGFGFLVSILSAPVVVRSILLFKRRAALGVGTSPAQKVAFVLGSLLVVAIVYFVLAAALFGTLWATCLASAPGMVAPGPREPVYRFMGAMLAMGIPIATLVLLVRWVRRRWRHDTHATRLTDASPVRRAHARAVGRSAAAAAKIAGQRRTWVWVGGVAAVAALLALVVGAYRVATLAVMHTGSPWSGVRVVAGGLLLVGLASWFVYRLRALWIGRTKSPGSLDTGERED